MPEGEAEEIRRLAESLTAEMMPRTEAGGLLIDAMAAAARRMKRAADHEAAAIAHKVRHAAEDFDDDLYDRANALFATLADDPRAALRKLKRTPEGVERLIDAWSDLLADLTIGAWSDEQLGQAANLAGLQSRHAPTSRMGALNRALRGDFEALGPDDAADLAAEARRDWAKAQLIAMIEAQVDALDAHYQTLDFETLAVDRAEAGDRALFDTSKPACLARRYEADARRTFFKALKEFRQVEAEFQAAAEAPAAPPEPSQAAPRMGSFRAAPPPPAAGPFRPASEIPSGDVPPPIGADGRPVCYVPTPRPMF